MELKHATEQLNGKQNHKTSSDSNYQRNQKNLETKTAAINKIQVTDSPHKISMHRTSAH